MPLQKTSITTKIALAMLLNHLCIIYPTALGDRKLSTAFPRFSYKKSAVAATALISGGYAWATYTDKLPAWIPSATSLLSKVQQFCIDNPKTTFGTLLGTAGTCYGLYKMIYIQRALHILKTVPEVSGAPNSLKFSDDEVNEVSAFTKALHNQTDLELVNFELPAETPDCFRSKIALHHEEIIPKYMHDIIRQAVHNVGISKPIFFYQTLNLSHASSKWFNHVGLHPSRFTYLNPENLHIFKRASVPLSRVENSTNNCLRTIYHELCHIQKQHSHNTFLGTYNKLLKELSNYILTSITAALDALEKIADEIDALEKAPDRAFDSSIITEIPIRAGDIRQKIEHFQDSAPPTDAQTIYGLYQEMEAELGALYYLKRFHEITSSSDCYIEDGNHPTDEDQQRYNRLLLQRLENDPSADYTIVQELAKEYLIEKEPWFAAFFELKQFIADLNQPTAETGSAAASSSSK